MDSLIGEGAMGAVYLAEDTERGSRVALKVLAPDLARDERFRQRFLRESELAAKLDHPHIVPTVASGDKDGTLFLAMAYVEGSDLRQLLKREGRLEPQRAIGLTGQIAEALDAAHAEGLIHRDVKPGNILVTEKADGEHAYVCDFGLARHVSSVSSLTGERGFVGTIDYVPPEQIEGGPIDGRADVYSLGCVLYECLAGARPFDRESELSVVFAHLNEPPPLLSDLRPDLPEPFDGVFATALAKSPDDRYSTCGELVGAARAALQGKTVARRKTRRPLRLLGAVALLAAVGAAVGGVLVSRGNDHAQKLEALSLRPNALNLVDARTHRLAGRVDFGKQAPGSAVSDVAFAGGSAWVVLGGQQRVVRVDLATHKVTRVVKLPWAPGVRIASGGGSIWVTQDGGPEVVRIEARTGKVADRFSVNAGGAGIAYGAGSLWLGGGADVVRVDPLTGRVLRRIPNPGAATIAMWVVFADGAVWAARESGGLVTKIDPVDNRVTERTPLHGVISDLTVGGGFVWVSVIPDGIVFKLSEGDLSVQGTMPVGPDSERISTGGGYLWVANTAAKTVSFLDLGSGARRRLAAAAEPTTATYHDGLVWTGAAPVPRPLPPIAGEEVRMSTPEYLAGVPEDQRSYATCANLLNYPDSAGPDGTRLQPEVAAAMPAVSRDGRTYRFRIRRGFRFSPPSNEAVTAQTFRHTIERALSPKLGPYTPAALYASNIVGESAYGAGKAKHISGIGVRGNSLSITLVKPAGDFPAWISIPWFCSIPLSVGTDVPGNVASAGPYYTTTFTDARIVLVRNPNYAGDRPRRAERIVYTHDTPTPQAVALADRGTLDYLPSDLNNYSLLAPAGVLDGRYGPRSAAARAGGQRYFLEPAPAVDDIVFNTRRPLFRDLRLRHAVNFALDRRALAKAYYDAPTDQIIPPAVPGVSLVHVYPIDGPDLRTARRLAGRKKRAAVLYAPCGKGKVPVATIVRAELAKIGIAVSIVKSDDCSGGYDEPKAAHADLILAQTPFGSWSSEHDPAPFLDQALARGTYGAALGPGLWNDPAFRKRVERARPLRGQARIEAYARLERELMRAAPVAVYGSFVYPEYFAPKVGCKVFQAAHHFVDLGALCVPKKS